MRRCAIFVAALLFLVPGMPARSQVKLSVTGGTLSTLDFDRPWTWHGRALGVVLGFPVSDKWSIQLAGRRSGKGYWEEYGTKGCDEMRREPCSTGGGVALTYFEFMALADRRIELDDRVRLHLLVGPFGGASGSSGTYQDPRFRRRRRGPARARAVRQLGTAGRCVVQPWVREHRTHIRVRRARQHPWGESKDPDPDSARRPLLLDRLRRIGGAPVTGRAGGRCPRRPVSSRRFPLPSSGPARGRST